jgi:hypothetical protein
LAEGKDNVLVLDFAGNCERILTVKELSDHIKREYEKQHEDEEGSLKADALHLTGKGFAINFDVDDINLLSILERLSVEKDFYPTWQEASEAAQKIGFDSARDYARGYTLDDRLHSVPWNFYRDWPVGGWDVFLGKKPWGWLGYYPTCQEASKAVQERRLNGSNDYKKRYTLDDRLPSNPYMFYRDWPVGGWDVFLGKKPWGWLGYYTTCQEASEIVQKLGIKNKVEYKKRYKENNRLHSVPWNFYRDWPVGGCDVFFGKKPWGWLGYYSTWREAGDVAQKRGLHVKSVYREGYKLDDRLHSSPWIFYSDYPGWDVFLGKKEVE